MLTRSKLRVVVVSLFALTAVGWGIQHVSAQDRRAQPKRQVKPKGQVSVQKSRIQVREVVPELRKVIPGPGHTSGTNLVREEFELPGTESKEFSVKLPEPCVFRVTVHWTGKANQLRVQTFGKRRTPFAEESFQHPPDEKTGKGSLRVVIDEKHFRSLGGTCKVFLNNLSPAAANVRCMITIVPLDEARAKKQANFERFLASREQRGRGKSPFVAMFFHAADRHLQGYPGGKTDLDETFEDAIKRSGLSKQYLQGALREYKTLPAAQLDRLVPADMTPDRLLTTQGLTSERYFQAEVQAARQVGRLEYEPVGVAGEFQPTPFAVTSVEPAAGEPDQQITVHGSDFPQNAQVLLKDLWITADRAATFTFTIRRIALPDWLQTSPQGRIWAIINVGGESITTPMCETSGGASVSPDWTVRLMADKQHGHVPITITAMGLGYYYGYIAASMPINISPNQGETSLVLDYDLSGHSFTGSVAGASGAEVHADSRAGDAGGQMWFTIRQKDGGWPATTGWHASNRLSFKAPRYLRAGPYQVAVENPATGKNTWETPRDFHLRFNEFLLAFSSVDVIEESDDEGTQFPPFWDDNEDEPYLSWGCWTGNRILIGVTDNGSELNSGETHHFTEGVVFGPDRPWDDGIYIEAYAYEKDGSGDPVDRLANAVGQIAQGAYDLWTLSASTEAALEGKETTKKGGVAEIGKNLVGGVLDLFGIFSMSMDGDDFMGDWEIDYQAPNLVQLVEHSGANYNFSRSRIISGHGCKWRVNWTVHRVPPSGGPIR